MRLIDLAPVSRIPWPRDLSGRSLLSGEPVLLERHGADVIECRMLADARHKSRANRPLRPLQHVWLGSVDRGGVQPSANPIRA